MTEEIPKSNGNAEGFIKIRRGLLKHLELGRLTAHDLGLYLAILLQANYRTGLWVGSAAKLFAIFPKENTLRRTQRSLERIEQIGFIKRFRVPGRKHNYPVLINKFECTKGVLTGYRLNAEVSTDYRHPVYDHVTVGTDSDPIISGHKFECTKGVLTGYGLNAEVSTDYRHPVYDHVTELTLSCHGADAELTPIQEVRSKKEEKEVRGERKTGVLLPTPSKRKSFPVDFTLSPELASLAIKRGLDPTATFAHFKDHHTAKGSRFVDWVAAWRTWLANSGRFGGVPLSPPPLRPAETFDQKMAREIREDAERQRRRANARK